MGLDPSNYSGHSFRRGGASFAFEIGLTLTEVKERGDWRSNAVHGYIVLSDKQKIARVLAKGAKQSIAM